MARLFKILLLILLLLLLSIGGLTTWVVASEQGTAKLMQLAERYAPGELQWDEANGKISGPLQFKNLSYQQPDGLSLSLGDALLEWHPSQLFSRKLKLDRLQLVDLEIHLPEPKAENTEKSNAPVELPDIDLPIDLEVDILFLKNIQIFPYGAKEPIVIEEIKLAALGSNEAFQVVSLDFSMPEASAQLSGRIAPRGDYPLDLKLQWQYQHPQYGEFTGNSSAFGDLLALQSEHQINGAASVAVKAELSELLNNPGWDATVDLSSEDLGIFVADLKQSPLKAKLKSSGNLQDFSANGNIQSSVEQTGTIALDLDIQGNTQTINIHKLLLQLADRPGQISVHGSSNLEPLALQLAGDWKSLTWPLVGNDPEYQLPQGEFNFNGSPEDFVAQITTKLDGKLTGPLNAAINAERKGQQITLSQLKLNQQDGDLKLNANGAYNLESQKLQAEGNWQKLQWPIVAVDVTQAKSDAGKFNVQGAVSDYQFQLEADAGGPQIPAGNWTAKGQGSDKGLTNFAVLGKTLQGQLQANGKASWLPQVDWDIQLQGDEINPGVQWPEFPAKLNLSLASSGSLTDSGANVNADILRLDGEFRGMPVKGAGKVRMQGSNVNIDDLKISSGPSNISANGKLGEQWDLTWKLNAANLSRLVPNLKGKITSSGNLSGPKLQPSAEFKLRIDRLNYAGTTIKSLSGTGNVDISGSKQSNIKLNGKGLTLAGQDWDKFNLNASGRPETHTLQTSLHGKIANLNLGISGGLQGKSWAGKLRQLDILKTEFGDWKLQSPANITANADAAKADKLCLHSKPTTICAQGGWNANQGSSGKLTLSKLEPARFSQFIPSHIKLRTALNGEVDGAINKQGKLKANAEFKMAPGRILITGDTTPLTFKFNESRLSSQINNNLANNQLLLDLGKMGQIQADANIKDFTGNPVLDGRLKGNISDLSIISSLAPQIQAIQGVVNTDLKFSGSLTNPAIVGAMKLEGFSAEVPQVNLKIEDTTLSLSSTGPGKLQVAGLAHSGEGKLTLKGDVDPATRSLNLHLQGQNFRVANTKDIQAVLTPDFTINMDNEGMNVKGVLVVPSAYVNAGGSRGEDAVVSVSSDVVFIDENGNAEPQSKNQSLSLNLRIVLGDDIKVEAGDFNGGLAGTVLIEQTPQLAPRGTGTIEVVNGDYVIYGQQLNMQRGRILFSGGPIDNPRLDMDVAREVPAYDVTAGAKIRGTAQSPILELYSDPAMPDASVLSYILLGQPPGTRGGSYTLGKYLTPDLYVSYGIGLFNAINTFNLRYKLTDKLSLQAKSGMANSADLIYSFER